MTDKYILREQLNGWSDTEVSMYILGQCLGLISEQTSFSASKPVIETNNEIAYLLYRILEDLTNLGILEKRDEPDYEYKWSSLYLERYPLWRNVGLLPNIGK